VEESLRLTWCFQNQHHQNNFLYLDFIVLSPYSSGPFFECLRIQTDPLVLLLFSV
jgi:hypothetical protein